MFITRGMCFLQQVYLLILAVTVFSLLIAPLHWKVALRRMRQTKLLLTYLYHIHWSYVLTIQAHIATHAHNTFTIHTCTHMNMYNRMHMHTYAVLSSVRLSFVHPSDWLSLHPSEYTDQEVPVLCTSAHW